MLRARFVPFIVVLPNRFDGLMTSVVHAAVPPLLRRTGQHLLPKHVIAQFCQGCDVPPCKGCLLAFALLCTLLAVVHPSVCVRFERICPSVQAAKTMAGVEVSAWGAVQNWRTWYLAVINLCDSTVKYAIIYWCPLIIYHMVGENMPHTAGEAVVPHDALVALLTALPFGFAAVFMLVNARHSAATGQRYYCPA